MWRFGDTSCGGIHVEYYCWLYLYRNAISCSQDGATFDHSDIVIRIYQHHPFYIKDAIGRCSFVPGVSLHVCWDRDLLVKEGISGTTYKAVLVFHWCAEPGRRRMGGVRSCEFTLLPFEFALVEPVGDFHSHILRSWAGLSGCLGATLDVAVYFLFPFIRRKSIALKLWMVVRIYFVENYHQNGNNYSIVLIVSWSCPVWISFMHEAWELD